MYTEEERKQIMIDADVAMARADRQMAVNKAVSATTITMASTKEQPAFPVHPAPGEQDEVKFTAGESVKALSEKVNLGIKNILARKEAADFTAAQELFFARNPKLAHAYVNANG